MSNKSNDKGRAYEFSCLNALQNEISKIRPTSVVRNSSFYASEKAWNKLTREEKEIFKISACAGIDTIFNFEPMILNGNDLLELEIQSDENGKKGDVRDILITRKKVNWQIGLSIKHNNDAVKHSRISKNLDFGDKWYGINCSDEYWDEVYPVFDYLDLEKQKGSAWKELSNK